MFAMLFSNSEKPGSYYHLCIFGYDSLICGHQAPITVLPPPHVMPSSPSSGSLTSCWVTALALNVPFTPLGLGLPILTLFGLRLPMLGGPLLDVHLTLFGSDSPCCKLPPCPVCMSYSPSWALPSCTKLLPTVQTPPSPTQTPPPTPGHGSPWPHPTPPHKEACLALPHLKDQPVYEGGEEEKSTWLLDMCVVRNIFAECCWIPEKSGPKAIFTWSRMLIPAPPREGGSSIYCEPH